MLMALLTCTLVQRRQPEKRRTGYRPFLENTGLPTCVFMDQLLPILIKAGKWMILKSQNRPYMRVINESWNLVIYNSGFPYALYIMPIAKCKCADSKQSGQ